MVSKLPKMTVRIEKEYIQKLDFISHKNRRKRNQEICFVLISYIEQFEKKNGPIKTDDLPEADEE